MHKLEPNLTGGVKNEIDFFLKSSEAYRPYPCNVSGGNPQF